MSDQQFQITLIATVARAIVLVAAIISGMISIYLGWKLYAMALSSATRGDIHLPNGVKIKLAAAGPGVFFVAFGTWLVVNVVNREYSVSTTPVALQGESSSVPKAVFKEPSKIDLDSIVPVIDEKAKKNEKPAKAPTPNCAVAWTVRFYTGSLPPPSANELTNAFDVAVKSLQESIRQREKSDTVDLSDPQFQAINVLKLAKSNVVK